MNLNDGRKRKFHGRKCNSNQKWNNRINADVNAKIRENIVRKNCFWNLSACNCKSLGSVTGDSVIRHDEYIAFKTLKLKT